MDAEQIAAKRLRALGYNFRDFSIDDFVAWVEKSIERKIFFFPWEMPPGLFGAWLSDGEQPTEYIFYRSNAESLHQIHIQLHEVAHILLGHPTLKITKETLGQSWFGKTDLPFQDLILLRSEKITDYEIEAETLTNMIQEQVFLHAEIRRLTDGVSFNSDIAKYLEDLGMLE